MIAYTFSDASVCDKSRCVGWAAWILGENGHNIRLTGAYVMRKRKKRGVNSNFAEYLALKIGVDAAKHLHYKYITAHSDCLAVVSSVNKGCLKSRPHVIDAEYSNGHAYKTKKFREKAMLWCDKTARWSMRVRRNRLIALGAASE